MKVKLLLLLFSYLLSWHVSAEKIIDELSLPIEYYQDKDTHRLIELIPEGEFVLRIKYWDYMGYPAGNRYSIEFLGYIDKSRAQNKSIFNSGLSGRSQNEVNRNSWDGTSYKERQYDDDDLNDLKHTIYLSNGIWETRFAKDYFGNIGVLYGRLNDDGTLEVAQAIHLGGGDETWNKLVKFLRKAHNLNIGQPK